MESRKGGGHWEAGRRTCSLAEKRKEIKRVRSESTLLLHVSAVGQQLFGSSVAPNRFRVSDTRLHRMITPAKLIQACFMLICIHAQHWQFSRPPLSGRLIPTCHNLFSSILPVNPQPPFIYFFSPHPLPPFSLLLCHADSIPSSSDSPPRHHPATLSSWLPTAALNSLRAGDVFDEKARAG